jgi:hypothetical protein
LAQVEWVALKVLEVVAAVILCLEASLQQVVAVVDILAL